MNPSSSPTRQSRIHQDSRSREVFSQQVRLLYNNITVGLAVTLIATLVLGSLEWGVVRHPVIVGWCLFMFVTCAGRLTLAQRYRSAAPSSLDAGSWGVAFAVGSGLAGVGWGAAGVLLYPAAPLANQVFLIFVLGGMMLGAASLLAPRPEAFLAFLIPTGFAPAVRMLLQGDTAHLSMGLLAALFTLATLVTTLRIHMTITSSLSLQFENQDLVEDLRAAKKDVDGLNERLETRVRERTAELQRSTEQLRAEIIQREQVEEELLRARKLESLGVLAGGIAHDFNNFLTVVLGNVELARMQLDVDDPVQPMLHQTVSACERAVFLSSQLLTFAKGGAPVRRLVSVSKLITDAVQLARAGAEISIEVSIAKDLQHAEVDPGQISQVFHNILLNARQAMPQGGIIEIHAANLVADGESRPNPRVRISIRDYGCGISGDDLPRIFDPYFTTKSGGNGLGLATAYAIIAKHGGSISVESKHGVGTVFHIDLPAAQGAPIPETPLVAPAPTGTERLLVMDDEEPIRRLLYTVLTNMGYEVQTARDGAETIALFEDARARGRGFDAILLDLTVSGGMGGMEAAARLKELDSSLKLIVSSGYSDAPVMSDFRNYGFDEAIIKPWTATEIGKVFQRVLVSNPDRKSH